MRHFAHLEAPRRAALFHRAPEYVAADGDRKLVATGLGGVGLVARGRRRATAS